MSGGVGFTGLAGLSAGGKGVINAKIKEIQVKERRERRE